MDQDSSVPEDVRCHISQVDLRITTASTTFGDDARRRRAKQFLET